VLVFGDLYALYNNPPSVLRPSDDSLIHPDHLEADEIVAHPFSGKSIPFWLITAYLSSNAILNLLNYYWFNRMIQTVSSRFTKKDKPAKKERREKKEKKENIEVDADGKVRVEGTDVNVGTTVEVAKEKLKKRTVTRQA